MVINHNSMAAFASRMNGINVGNIQKDMEKLSSGERINRSANDASGLAVSEKMRSQIRGLNQASKNVGDAVSLTSVSEGYLQETTDILQRIRELAVQAGNGVYSDEDRGMIALEVSQLVSEIDRIASTAQFNGMNLLTGRFAENGIQFQVGANVDQNIKINIGDMSATALGLKNAQGSGETISIASADQANMAIGTIDEALKTVSQQRANLGAVTNRMEVAQKGINIAAENLQASESRIRDVDMAAQTVELVKNEILQNASTAMLSQALYSNRDSVLRLLS